MTMREYVRPAWLPIIEAVEYTQPGLVVGEIHEYGCGAYGCVFPTHDPKVVLKITADDTEAEFAAMLAPSIAAPICTDYYTVLKLGKKFKDSHKGTEKTELYLLWREAASHVGDAERLGKAARRLILEQHGRAQAAYHAIFHHQDDQVIAGDVRAWLAALDRMAEDPTVGALGAGMARTFREQRILFGDVHDGNVGIVHRGADDMWVITDPGHVAVVEVDLDAHVATLRRQSTPRPGPAVTTRLSR
jgi:hypothetical protein